MSEETNRPTPQKEDGYIAIANEIWDVLSMVKLTQYQWAAIRLVFRMSYGCNQKVCRFKAWADFHYCAGIAFSKITSTLESLEKVNILVIDWDQRIVHFNKRYDTWDIKMVTGFEPDRYADLLLYNIKNRRTLIGMSKKVIDPNRYVQKGNTIIPNRYDRITQKVMMHPNRVVDEPAPDKENSKSGKNVADPDLPDLPFKEKEKGFDDEKKFEWVCDLFQKAAPGWSPVNDYIIDAVKEICEYPDDYIEAVFRRAGENGIKRQQLLSYVRKGLQNYDSLYNTTDKNPQQPNPKEEIKRLRAALEEFKADPNYVEGREWEVEYTTRLETQIEQLEAERNE